MRPSEPVTTWNLGLPGYNTFNETASLEYFLDRVRPNAVVLAPSMNDIDTSASVLPDGSLAEMVGPVNPFREVHPHTYRVRLIDSFTYLQRWHSVMNEIGRLESRLRERKIPLVLFFTGRWREPFVHRLISDSGIRVPYAVLPLDLTRSRWLLPVHGHPNPAAHALHARIVYRLLRAALGWPPLPPPHEAVDQVVVHIGAPPGDWQAATAPMLAEMSKRQLGQEFVPGTNRQACLGGVDCRTGLLSRSGSVILRRRAGATLVEVALAPLQESPGAYPMRIAVEILSRRDSKVATVELGAADARLSIPLPRDIPEGCAMEIVIIPGRSVAGEQGLAARSAWLTAVRQS